MHKFQIYFHCRLYKLQNYLLSTKLPVGYWHLNWDRKWWVDRPFTVSETYMGISSYVYCNYGKNIFDHAFHHLWLGCKELFGGLYSDYSHDIKRQASFVVCWMIEWRLINSVGSFKFLWTTPQSSWIFQVKVWSICF